MYLINIKQS